MEVVLRRVRDDFVGGAEDAGGGHVTPRAALEVQRNGAQLRILENGRIVGSATALEEAADLVPELFEVRPGDVLEVDDSVERDELLRLLRVDLSAEKYPGDVFNIEVNDETLDLETDRLGVESEVVISLDDGGVVGESIFRAGPWLYVYSEGVEESWRLAGEFDGRAEALSYLRSNMFLEGGGEFEFLDLNSKFLIASDGPAVLDALGALVSDGGCLLLNGFELLPPVGEPEAAP
jgi:hypothetical protein